MVPRAGRSQELDDTDFVAHFQIVDEVTDGHFPPQAAAGLMFRQDYLVCTYLQQNLSLRNRQSLSDDALYTQLPQEDGGQQIVFKVGTDADESGVERFDAGLAQGVNVGRVQLHNVWKFATKRLHAIMIRVYGQHGPAVFDESCCDGGAKATQTDDYEF